MNTIHKISTLLILCFLSVSCQEASSESIVLPYYPSADFTPQWIDDPVELAGLHQIGDFALLNQNGDTIRQQHLEDKIYVANFFFTSCPGICPKLTANFSVVQAAIQKADDVLLLSHSVMPWVDSVPKLREYADYNAVIDEKWHLLTGPQTEINQLARNSYFAEKELGLKKDTEDFLHTENMILVDYQGHIRGIYNGTITVEMDRLIEDIEILRKERVLSIKGMARSL